MLIGIIGVDGSGKTTQIKKLRNYLIKENYFVETPLITSFAKQCAHRIAWKLGYKNAYSLFDLKALHLAAAFDDLREIQNYLFQEVKNRCIIFDKYITSWKAIAMTYGLDDFREIDLIYNEIPKLDIQFFLKIDLEKALERIFHREKGFFHDENPEIIRKYIESLEYLTKNDENTIIIDAELPLNEVHAHIVHELKTRNNILR